MKRLFALLLSVVFLTAACGSSKSSTSTTASTAATTTTSAPARVSTSGKQYKASLAPTWTIQTVPFTGFPEGFELLEAANMPLQWNEDGSTKGDVPSGAISITVGDAPLTSLPKDNGDPATMSLKDLANLTSGVLEGTTDVKDLNVDSSAKLDGETAYAYAISSKFNGRVSTDYAISARHAGYFYGIAGTAESTADAKAALDDFVASWHWD